MIKTIQTKICGIQCPKTAFQTAKHGADYIGMIFHAPSRRHINLHTAKLITEAAKRGGATPVGVFVRQTAEKITQIAHALNLQVVQLHGDVPRATHQALPKHLTKIFVIHVNRTGPIPLDNAIKALNPERDYLLFDGPVGGEGRRIPLEHLQKAAGRFKFFVAGGLTHEHIDSVMSHCNPDGLDVSSGVENQQGEKDQNLIAQFISKAHQKQGDFGGIYMPESLISPIKQLGDAFEACQHDRDFKAALCNLLKNYAGRETPLTEVMQFRKQLGGPRLFLKREDLLHTGAHKINNALGQCLLAKKMGKTRIIAETGAGQHGVATATACAYLHLPCVIYMGEKDVTRQHPNVQKMKLLGAEIIPVKTGSKTLKDAVNAALRDYAAHFEYTHYCLGSALGPYPYPEMVAYFQSVIGQETKQQCHDIFGKNPDLVIACVGGGSNAIGMFSAFIKDRHVKLVGVEAGGISHKPGEHAARFMGGKPGVLHGCYSYLLQTQAGQVMQTHSISAGLDYPMVGPQHAALYESKRVQYTVVQDKDALAAFKLLAKTEGIIPALESAHALAYYMKIAKNLNPKSTVLINLSGRGDKDLPQLLSEGLI